MKSLYVDWTKDTINDEWDFIGARVMEQKAEDEKNSLFEQGLLNEAEEIYPDDIYSDNVPMYNFAYPLNTAIDEDNIFQVCKNTACTVVYNNYSGSYFLALCGCGMDFSQSIALAYILAEGCIDWDFIDDVYIGCPMNVGKSDYTKILNELKRQLKISIDNKKDKLKRVKLEIEKLPN